MEDLQAAYAELEPECENIQEERLKLEEQVKLEEQLKLEQEEQLKLEAAELEEQLKVLRGGNPLAGCEGEEQTNRFGFEDEERRARWQIEDNKIEDETKFSTKQPGPSFDKVNEVIQSIRQHNAKLSGDGCVIS